MTADRNERRAPLGLRRGLAPALGVVPLAVLAACGGGDPGAATSLTWYTIPDNGGQAEVAAACSESSEGAYTIETASLPSDADAQREQLIRRLAANDASIDIMSLDPPFVPEFAEAGFIADIPDELAETFTDDVFDAAVESATWKDELVAAPMWTNTQLLWYRTSVAEEAGLDLESGPVTWEQVIDAAEETGTTISVQANRYEGYTVWINALIEGAGGQVLENPEAEPEDLELGLDGDAAAEAAAVIRQAVDAGVVGPSVSTSTEEESLALFQREGSGFMVNWPYVYEAFNGAVESGALDEAFLDDLGWTTYPRTVEGEEAAPPFGGGAVGVGAFSENGDLALEAVECLVSPESQKLLWQVNGVPAATRSVYDDEEIQEQYPAADAIRESMELSRPRPLTPYYGEVSQSLQRTFHPPGEVDPDRTPQEAADLIQGVLAKEDLL
ncbi:extracellular solute-binding protein [Aquipuribacter nitratireducens]|uniref:Extracellular solute-binding protein n=1 Tax=Aquipuribacter nitratireducens TaxID=650104 RepID=A0ABW0GJZ7_9MICO